MENIADYIPLFLILGSIIISFFQKTKKKSENKQPDTEYSQPIPDSIDFPEPYIPEPILSKPAYTQTIKENTKRASKRTESITKQTPEPEEEISYDLDLADMDELKKAVIYSEIINRKEY